MERLTGATTDEPLRLAAVGRARWIPENGTQVWLFEADLAKALADLKWAFGGKTYSLSDAFGTHSISRAHSSRVVVLLRNASNASW